MLFIKHYRKASHLLIIASIQRSGPKILHPSSDDTDMELLHTGALGHSDC